ncbi:MAG: SUF system NifU family Fe-S cluster assembly protein [Deltaproteobacteria bacterium]|nr:SUF system NifU family Fe-S cluster assembly protein [Deltaproteobacteria bacterium]
MMSDISDLYREVILDHNKSPRNFRKMEGADRTAEGYNPLCGDQITVYVKMQDGVINEITFQGSGCAISKASASMMTASVKGKTAGEAERVFQDVHKMLTGELNPDAGTERLGKLAALSGVCNFPARVKCASLSWHTLRAALKEERGVTSTE